MHSDFMPRIQVSIESTKAAIITQMGIAGSEFGVLVQERLDQCLKSEDFNKVIDQSIHEAINDEIKRYFQYGKGRSLIGDSISGSLDDLFPSKKGDVEK